MILSAALALSACATTPQTTVVKRPCPALVLSELEERPAAPDLSPHYAAMYAALGEAVTVSVVKWVEVQAPGYMGRLEARAAAARTACLAP